MADLLDRLVTMLGVMAGAWLYTRNPRRSFLSVMGLVLVIAWGSRLVLDVVTQ